MVTQNEKPSVVLIDPLNADQGHPMDDDLFLTKCLEPLTDGFLVVSSPGSVDRVRRQCHVAIREISRMDMAARFPRLRLLWISCCVSPRGFGHVVFQSFEEVSVLLFMLLHPLTHVHLIVTSNLRPDRRERHPILGGFLLRAVLRRATSLIVHCQREVETITGLVPGIGSDKIFVKPFHQFSAPRNRLPWREKSPTVLFLGPECPHKQLGPVLDLILSDSTCLYRYVLAGMGEMAPEVHPWLKARDNVEVMFGHICDDTYYRLFSEAALVILTHDRRYEGALSGAFCDAIASGTVVVATDMAPFNEYFNRFGAMGFLVDYSDRTWCEQVLNCDLAAEYDEFQQNMATLRDACGTDAVRDVFRSAFNRACFMDADHQRLAN